VSRAALAGLIACVVGLTMSACGSSASKHGHGPVSVIYAGSLSGLMERVLGPAFDRAEGYSFEGFGAGSGEAAKQIKGRVRQADVFVSASVEADRELEGVAGGDWVSWHATFATTPLVLGYDPNSDVGRELAHGEPWYLAITRPGARVGRTDPKLDPKGKLTVEAIAQASSRLGQPRLVKSLSSSAVFPETDLLGRLQAGQLDAGFFYASEANAARIPTVALTPVFVTASYTVTILNRAPHRSGAEAFVRYLLSGKGSSILLQSGLHAISPPRLAGDATSVPMPVQSAFAAGGR
jgi:molybdate/tungstate transport system substrate-binding protein